MNKSIHLESNNVLNKDAKNKSSGRFITQVLIFVLFLFSIVLVSMVLMMTNLFEKYHEDDRITYVTLDPVGNWTVERTNRQKDDFYQATVDSIISRLMQKCFSMNPATIYNDWAICSNFLSEDALSEFITNNHFIKDNASFNNFVTEKSDCFNCKKIIFKVRDIDHKNVIPTSFQDVYGFDVEIYESLVYGNFIDSDGKDLSAVIDLKWSFFSKNKTSKLGELLVDNPLGIYFIQFSVVEDIQK